MKDGRIGIGELQIGMTSKKQQGHLENKQIQFSKSIVIDRAVLVKANMFSGLNEVVPNKTLMRFLSSAVVKLYELLPPWVS